MTTADRASGARRLHRLSRAARRAARASTAAARARLAALGYSESLDEAPALVRRPNR